MSKKDEEKKNGDKLVTDQQVTEPSTIDNQQERLIPLKLWNRFHHWPPTGGMRHIRTNMAKKGACHLFVKKGGLVLVRERAFWEWASTSDAS